MRDSELDRGADHRIGQMEKESTLVHENARLLEELEDAYLQMEAYMGASQEEVGVAYRELEEKTRTLATRLSELEQAHGALKEAEDKYRSIVEHSQDAIFRRDIEGNYLLISPVVKQLTGYTPEEFYADQRIGCQIVLGEDIEKVEEGFRKASVGKISRDVEYRVRGKDGKISWVSQTTFPIWDAEGRIVAIEGTIRNITEHRRAEEALREAQEKSVQQERLAAVGQLAAGIAHDFNNLLTGIIGYAQLLEMRIDMSETAKTDLRRIVRQGQHAAHLIRQILDFSRKSRMQRQPLNVQTVLGESIKFLQRSIPENIHIVQHVDAGEYYVYADSAQIQQVVTNLAVNARDAMPRGGELRVGLSRFILNAGESPPAQEMSPGEWVVLSISDTGTGIASEHLSHIYEPFFTTKEVGEGTGLGLAQVYGIVMQHEGFIDVKSEAGKGTEFTVYLSALHVRKEEPEDEVLEEPPHSRGETILVVEDEPKVLDPIRDMLQQLGCRVLAAGSGEEALAVYDRQGDKIELVLTDMVMPGMSGEELFYALRQQHPDVKVVVMTGYPLTDEGEGLLSRGIVAWIRKPLDFAKLTQMLDTVFT